MWKLSRYIKKSFIIKIFKKSFFIHYSYGLRQSRKNYIVSWIPFWLNGALMDTPCLFIKYFQSHFNSHLAFCNLQLTFCSLQLSFCNLQLSFCNSQLAFCNSQLAFCNSQLAFCNLKLSFCSLWLYKSKLILSVFTWSSPKSLETYNLHLHLATRQKVNLNNIYWYSQFCGNERCWWEFYERITSIIKIKF